MMGFLKTAPGEKSYQIPIYGKRQNQYFVEQITLNGNWHNYYITVPNIFNGFFGEEALRADA